MSPFAVLVLKRAEMFHHMYVDIKENGIMKHVEMFGAEAMQFRFDKCEEVGPECQDLKEMRTYKGMLTSRQEQAFEKWNTEAVTNSKERLQKAKAKALKDIEEKTIQQKKRGDKGNVQTVACPPLKAIKAEGASSSRNRNPADPPQHAEKDEDCDSCEEETGLMSFFGTKAL